MINFLSVKKQLFISVEKQMNKFVLYWTVKTFFFPCITDADLCHFNVLILYCCIWKILPFLVQNVPFLFFAHIFEQFCYHFNCWFFYESMCILFYFSSADFFNSARFGERTTVQYIDIVRNFWKQNVFYKYNVFRQ